MSDPGGGSPPGRAPQPGGGAAAARRPRLFYGWYVLAASFLILFLNAGGRYIIGVMVKPIATEFAWSRGSISAAIFLNMAVYAVAVLVTGRLYDRWGPKWVIAVSTLLFCLGYGLMAVMQSLWQFLLFYGLLAGAGFGGTTVPLFGSIIGNWFERWRGLAVSLAFAGTCLGQFILVPVFSGMIDGPGWRVTSLWIAGLAFVVNLALAFTVIRSDPPAMGLRAYGRERRREAVVESGPSGAGPRGAAAAAPAQAERATGDLTLSQAMRTRSLWLFTLAMFACGGADFLLTTHLVPMVTDYGLSNSVAASMLAWAGLLSLAGILLAGPAADAIGNKIPIAATFALRVVLFLIVFLFKGAVPFWVYSLGLGLTLLVTAPLTATLVGALYGVTHLGFISGFINTVHMMGGGLWAYLGGLVFDRTGGYDLAFAVSAGTSALALICTLLIREVRHQPPGDSTSAS